MTHGSRVFPDFGKSDEWRKPFELLVDIQNRSHVLSVDGRLGLSEFVHHCLCVSHRRARACVCVHVSSRGVDNSQLRLRIQAEAAAHPELRDIDIVSPCVVTGVPRAGQSTIHNLLALDPAVQCATLMEQLKVCSPAT